MIQAVVLFMRAAAYQIKINYFKYRYYNKKEKPAESKPQAG